MKKLSIIFVLITLFASFVQANVVYTTLDQAKAHCALPSTMKFTPQSKIVPDSKGIINGVSANNISFQSWNTANQNPYTAAPSKRYGLNANYNIIDGAYGYKSGELITCYYTYKSYMGTTVYITMRSQS